MTNKKSPPPVPGELATVELPVRVVFEWSDKIVADYDAETGYTEYKSGFIMKPLDGQTFVYKGEDRLTEAYAYFERREEEG